LTEAEWLDCFDPGPMLRFLEGRVSPRKLRLFACACCRLCWNCLPDQWSRAAVEVAERYADGMASGEELGLRRRGISPGEVFGFASRAAVQNHAAVVQNYAAGAAYAATLESGPEDGYAFLVHLFGRPVLAVVLREVVGSPFRRPHIDPPSLRWNEGAVRRVAQGIYDDRAFDRLPILADALMDAGCDDEAILAHCRSEGPHVRGCWVIDLILGKE
jgi:hypothetical protein